MSKVLAGCEVILRQQGTLANHPICQSDAVVTYCGNHAENSTCVEITFISTLTQDDRLKFPCSSPRSPCWPPDDQKPAVPVRVDSLLVGAWELTVSNPLGDSRWVWEIRQDGTYEFHAEGAGAVPPHAGTLMASNGHYGLRSTTMNYSDEGAYQLVANATLITLGRLGKETWHRVQPKGAASSGTSK